MGSGLTFRRCPFISPAVVHLMLLWTDYFMCGVYFLGPLPFGAYLPPGPFSNSALLFALLLGGSLDVFVWMYAFCMYCMCFIVTRMKINYVMWENDVLDNFKSTNLLPIDLNISICFS